MIFDCDDIHRIRVENAERRANMTKEGARRDLKEGAENTRRAIEEIRRANAMKTG
jgi:hypothetical protein